MTISVKGAVQVKNEQGRVEYSELLAKDFSVAEHYIRHLKIAAGSIDANLDLGGVSDITFALILSDLPVAPKINGALSALPAGNMFVFSGSTGSYITDIKLSNAAGTDANLRVILG